MLRLSRDAPTPAEVVNNRNRVSCSVCAVSLDNTTPTGRNTWRASDYANQFFDKTAIERGKLPGTALSGET